MYRFFGGIVALILICFSQPLLAEERDSSGFQHLPEIHADQGRVVFFRSRELSFSMIGCGIALNQQRVSSLGAGHFFAIDLIPGAHTFGVLGRDESLSIEVRAGETRYVRCLMRSNFVFARPTLVRSSSDTFFEQSAELSYVDAEDRSDLVVAPVQS
jgi:hypothetical protein